ncbi:MAG: hypothetical protein IKN54_09415 [Lachnospiraceae bacterium]|nr:hypothetical protein [Lachnospiraceae bacterium]
MANTNCCCSGNITNSPDSCCCNGNGNDTNDVCVTPVYGQPKYLSVYAPVIYDEIGINLGRQITVPADIIAANPTVNCVQLEVQNITFTPATTGIPGTTVTLLRANCVSVLLTNILIVFNVRLFDRCMNFLDSTTVTANYLPANAASPDFAFLDPDTNPDSVTVSLYAPYGVATDSTGAIVINPVALGSDANVGIINGINATAYAKGMNLNTTTGVLSAGISIVLRTVYYEAYKPQHFGKTVVPKASTAENVNNDVLTFVEGGLLSREIKPLELEPPRCEQRYKRNDDTICERNSGFEQIENGCRIRTGSENNGENSDCYGVNEINCGGVVCTKDD